ncbi:MAG TPA: RecX family transcriptional regulator [Tepidisphaeraceae bacterium]|nr:RecX family transcriptional regulator [Tepidisphaeraceae bacterium]
MPLLTDITEQKRNPNRRNIFLDGKFAFGCNLNVVAKFRLRAGLQLDDQQISEIELGAVKQECFDSAMRFLAMRLHSRAELYRKLSRREWGEKVIDATLDDLTRLNYLDDERFAKTKALSAVQHKKHGKRRAFVELIKSGVKGETAEKVLRDVYSEHDSSAIARQLAEKQLPRLKKMEPLVARRRLVGMLQRRGFDYDAIKPLLDDLPGARED